MLKFGMLVLATSIILMSCQSPTSSSTGGSSNATSTPSLSAWKVQTPAPRTDASGNALPSNSQPFGSIVSTLVPHEQIILSGTQYQGNEFSILDYALSATTPTLEAALPKSSSTSWTEKYHVSVGARLSTAVSGQSVVNLVFVPAKTTATGATQTGTITFFVWDPTTKTTTQISPPAALSQAFNLYFPTGWSNANISTMSIAAADINGDGLDEIAICVGNSFFILDSTLTKVLYSDMTSMASTDVSNFHPSQVVAGDLLGNGQKEFLLTNGSSISTYVGAYQVIGSNSSNQIAVIDHGSLSANGTYLNWATAAIGDINGDGHPDIVFSGPTGGSNSGNLLTMVADWTATSGLSWKTNTYEWQVGPSRWGFNPIVPLVLLNPDGVVNLKKIVCVGDHFLSYSDSGGFTYGYDGKNAFSYPAEANIAAGDINHDGKDDLVYIDGAGSNGQTKLIYVYSLDSTNSKWVTTSISAIAEPTDTLVLADPDAQSMAVQYLSQTVQYNNPSIVAVLASPPYYDDATTLGAFGNSNTSFSKSTGNSLGTGASITVSAGVTFGAEMEAPLEGDAAKSQEKTTISASLTVGFEATSETTFSKGFQQYAGANGVLFECIPYDVYTYKILSAPNAATVGTTPTIAFPRAPQLILMPQDDFNALPGNYMHVGSSVFPQTLGVPTSYMNKTTMVGLAKGGGLYDPSGNSAPVGGSNTTTDGISNSTTTMTSIGAGISISYSNEEVIAGVLFGAEVGLSMDASMSFGTSNSVEIDGTVSSITKTDQPFTYGIGMYQQTDPTVQKNPFLVVNYWVQ